MVNWYNRWIDSVAVFLFDYMSGLPFAKQITDAYSDWFGFQGGYEFVTHSFFSDLSKALVAGIFILLIRLLFQLIAYRMPETWRDKSTKVPLHFESDFLNFFFRTEEEDSLASIIIHPLIDFLILILVSIFTDPLVEHLVYLCRIYFNVNGAGPDIFIFLLLFFLLGLAYSFYYFAAHILLYGKEKSKIIPSGMLETMQIPMGKLSMGTPFVRAFILNMVPELIDVLLKTQALLLLFHCISARYNPLVLLLVLLLVIAACIGSAQLSELLSNILKQYYYLHRPLKSLSNVFVIFEETCMVIILFVMLGIQEEAQFMSLTNPQYGGLLLNLTNSDNAILDTLFELPFFICYNNQIPVSEFLMTYGDLFQWELYKSFYFFLIICMLNRLLHKIPTHPVVSAVLWWPKTSILVVFSSFFYYVLHLLFDSLASQSSYWKVIVFLITFLVVFIICPPLIHHILFIDVLLLVFIGVTGMLHIAPVNMVSDGSIILCTIYVLIFMILGIACSAVKGGMNLKSLFHG